MLVLLSTCLLNMNQQSFLYKFLLSPQFRMWRYLTLVIFFTVVSLNQAMVGYIELAPTIGNNIYWIVAVTISVYLGSVFLIKKKAVHYLIEGKYFLFVVNIISYALLYMAVANLAYDLYMKDYDFFSKSVITDNLSSFTLYILCILGVIIPIFLRNWITSNQLLDNLKLKQALSQVEQFKEQINPPSFFKTLNKSKESVKTEPEKASAMLIKLSQLLRYQLYDCNRQQVLLSAEISFLRNFLELEKLYSSDFEYSIQTEGNINGVFILPSIILPYVQSIINALDKKGTHILTVKIDQTDEIVSIIVATPDINNNALLETELQKVKERLATLYKDRYRLITTYNETGGATEIVLKLEKE